MHTTLFIEVRGFGKVSVTVCLLNHVRSDMKPENLLFKSEDSDAELAICDFG